jgi:phosphomannomutase/phosphoglucomutase
MLFLNQMRLRKALTYDQNLMLEIVENKLAGKQKNLFSNFALDENKDTIKQLSQLDATAVAAKQKPAKTKTNEAEEDGAPVFPSQVSQSEGQSANVEDISGSTISEEIFRKYDIRGVVGDTLSLEHAYVIGKAIGSLAIERGETDMLVARDGRISSKDLSSTLIRGICESGVNVVDLGLMPTPVMYFGTNFLSAKSGVMVTGSHNPPDYNGFKVVIAGNTLSGEDIEGLHGRIVTGRFNSGEGTKDELDISADYINRISEDVQLLKPMKVVLDCGHGAASVVARSLFESLSCEVISQYCDVDGNFPAHHPDPGNEENMAELAKAVVEENADLGIAFDGDGDRLGIVDSSGNIIKPDRVLMILAGDVLLRHPGADVIYDVKSTKLLASHILSSGGRPIMWKSGHSLMKAKMKETGALLGGEFSGHIFFTERWYGFDDALYSAARLLEVVSGDGRPSADMFAEIPDTINTSELQVSVAEGMQHTIMEKLTGATEKAFPNAKITDIDGIRAEYTGAWGLIRASNTTPHLVLRFEADNEEAMDKVQEVFRTVIKAVLPSAEIPF